MIVRVLLPLATLIGGTLLGILGVVLALPVAVPGILKIRVPEPSKHKADAVEAARLDGTEHLSTNSPA